MAQSRRNEPQRQTPTELERAVRKDGEQVAADNESPFGGGLLEETLDLGHARLRRECSVRPPQRALSRPLPARQRTAPHLVRPSIAAEARFVLESYEFLE